MAEAYRLSLVRGLEERLYLGGFARLAGVDEVGRGCLAGPVVAAAVVLPADRLIPGIDDSKRLDGAGRQRLDAIIRRQADAVAIGVVSAGTIDRINILEATRRAMLRCLAALEPKPDLTLVDAVRLDSAPCHCVPLVRGDSVAYAIACASIVAKVERDRLMTELDAEYPQYGFSSHKGYAAPAHLEALKTYGPTPVHRLTFRSVIPRRELPG